MQSWERRPRTGCSRTRSQAYRSGDPLEALVAFIVVSGSGKSSLAFGTLNAESQRRYLEPVLAYSRRRFHRMRVPEVDKITGLPPAQRGHTLYVLDEPATGCTLLTWKS